MNYILDTSFILSLFNAFDENHKLAVDKIFAVEDDAEFKIPYIVLAELALDVDADNVLKNAQILTTKVIENNAEDLNWISSTDANLRIKLKANDLLILSLCKRFGYGLLTFDKKLITVYNHEF